MLTLTLVRHAKAERDSADGSDYSRKLSDRGLTTAARMGAFLSEQAEIRPDRPVSSPAPRALATAHVLAKALGHLESAVVEADKAYEASVGELVTVLRQTPAECRHLMLTGHNPGLTDLANWLAGARKLWDLPTCGVVNLRLAVENWAEVAPGCGTLLTLWTPEELF